MRARCEVMANRSDRELGHPAECLRRQSLLSRVGPNSRIPSGPAVFETTASTGRTQDCTRPAAKNITSPLATREPSTQDLLRPDRRGARHHDDRVGGRELHDLARGEQRTRCFLAGHHQMPKPGGQAMAGVIAYGTDFRRRSERFSSRRSQSVARLWRSTRNGTGQHRLRDLR